MSRDEWTEGGSSEDRISLEASAWIAKRDGAFSGEDQDEFLEWLAKNPKHREIYNERQALWETMENLEDWRPEHSPEPNPDLLAWRQDKNKFYRLAIMGAIAAAAICSLLWQINSAEPVSESRVLAFGGADSYENHVLDDGSIVELNQGAEVSVQYTKKSRVVFLHKGEAHFMVAKDQRRPFLVRAGDAVVQATGTAFNVSLNQVGIEVLVTEGRVMVNAVQSDTEEVPYLDRIDPAVQELTAGQSSVLSSDRAALIEPVSVNSPEDIQKRLSWKSEALDFTETPLEAVLEDFNRRNVVKVVIGDPELRDLQITARLKSDNLDGFLALLEVAMGVSPLRENEFEIVLRTSD
jgi:transmembrane sensor